MKNILVTYKKDILFILFFGLFLLAMRLFVFSPVIVNGSSMEPTLEDKNRGIYLKIGEPDRFDIVVLNNPDPDSDKQHYIKRVIGLPGETVTYKDNQLYIDGEALEEPFLDAHTEEPLTEDLTYVVPENEYYLLGDNRNNSKDSRTFGAIDKTELNGVFKFRMYPFNQMGFY